MSRLAAGLVCVLALFAGPRARADNPFLPRYPVKTAVIAYESYEGRRKEMIYVKGDRVRREDVAGPFANGTYSITTPEYDYSVVPEQKKVIRRPSEAVQLQKIYRRLSERDQALVRQSLAKVGPDLPLYSEHDISFSQTRTIKGLVASCYTFHSTLLDDTSTRCFWRHVWVAHDGVNPLSGEVIAGHVTSVVLDQPLDDSRFTIPAGFAIEDSNPIDDVMQRLYEQLLARMTRVPFTLNDLSRYRN